jgi:hypothetical protein
MGHSRLAGLLAVLAFASCGGESLAVRRLRAEERRLARQVDNLKDLIQATKVNLQLGAGVRNRTKGRRVGHRVAGRRVDAAYTIFNDAVQCSLTGLQVGALLTRPPHQRRRVASARPSNNQITFECGCVDLQRSQRSRNVPAPPSLVNELLQPAC